MLSAGIVEEDCGDHGQVAGGVGDHGGAERVMGSRLANIPVAPKGSSLLRIESSTAVPSAFVTVV